MFKKLKEKSIKKFNDKKIKDEQSIKNQTNEEKLIIKINEYSTNKFNKEEYIKIIFVSNHDLIFFYYFVKNIKVMETVIIDVYHIFNVLVLVDINYKKKKKKRKEYQRDYNLLIIVE